MKKQTIPIAEGLPQVQKMIKSVALAAEIGKQSSWLHNKQNHNIINGKERQFIQSDIELINSALCETGKRLLTSAIVYSSDRDDVIRQMRNVCSTIRSAYIFEEKMGKGKAWLQNRMCKVSSSGKKSSFSSDDILNVNTLLMEISNHLLTVEFTL